MYALLQYVMHLATRETTKTVLPFLGSFVRCQHLCDGWKICGKVRKNLIHDLTIKNNLYYVVAQNEKGKNTHAPKKSTENRFLQIPFLIQAMAFMRDFVHQLKSFLFVFFVERIQEGKKYSRSSVESSQSIIFHYYFLSRDPDQG